MEEILSHPDRSLKEHLEEVKNWGNFYKQALNCEIIKEMDDDITDSFFLFHDIGKATAYFQRYIRKEKVPEDLKSHAGLSAMLFLYYHIVKDTIKEKEDLIVIMAYCILKHHGDLQNFSDIDNYMSDRKTQLLKAQYDTINYAGLIDILEEAGLERNALQVILNGEGERFILETGDFLKNRRRRRDRERSRLKRMKETPDRLSTKDYFTLQLCFSLLIDGDKSQVTLGDRNLAQRAEFTADVEKYIQSKDVKETSLNNFRSMAFYEVNDNIDTGSNIFTLTLPTGMGKTLNSLNYAIKLRKKLYEETKALYRIIYVIPFMSIIDQNARVIEEVLSADNRKVTNNILSKHHHLTELTWESDENTLIRKDNAQILLEGWNSEIIVTTFQQFFSTLAGYKNSMQRKFSKFCNSIVIIDEIQTIPVKYYKFIGRLLQDFAELLNSKVIAMTATQPRIFKEETSKSLCDYRKYYSGLSRTVVFNELRISCTPEEFVENLCCKEGKSYLFIVNTIECSKKVYHLLKDKFYDANITYLSTMLPPKKRLRRIYRIKQKKYDMAVSTQLVEAGVDIDFDVVYRDFAPLPSIFQSAGRANREGGEKKGEIHLIKLKYNNGYYSDQVYRNAKTDLDVTEKILSAYERLEEQEFMSVIERYFERMADGNVKSQHISEALIKGAASQWYYGDKTSYDSADQVLPLNCFELIENTGDKLSVFIELDDEAVQLWKEYTLISNEIEDKWEHKMNLKSIARKLSEYIVDVSVFTKNKYNRPPLDENQVYYYVSNNEIDKYYNSETGYGVESDVYYY